MPSIFIWKSDRPLPKKTIRMYSGSNWVLEESILKSYKYVDRKQIDNVIICNIVCMPHDWVGHELLEISDVPYEFINKNKYGTLEQIGKWLRFTSFVDSENDVQKILQFSRDQKE